MQQTINISTPAEQVAKLNRLIAENRAQILSLCAAMQQSQSLLQDLTGTARFPLVREGR
jgi:hypothetical protein